MRSDFSLKGFEIATKSSLGMTSQEKNGNTSYIPASRQVVMLGVRTTASTLFVWGSTASYPGYELQDT